MIIRCAACNVVSRLEHVTSSLQTAREAISKQQQGLNTAGLEQQIVGRELQELRSSAGTLAEVSRENERLKARVESQKAEISELGHRLQLSARDLGERSTSLKEIERKLSERTEEASTLREMKAALEEHVDQLTESSSSSGARALAAEAALREVKAAMDSTRQELDEEVSKYLFERFCI
jgi:chromosome segregation ATPase